MHLMCIKFEALSANSCYFLHVTTTQIENNRFSVGIPPGLPVRRHTMSRPQREAKSRALKNLEDIEAGCPLPLRERLFERGIERSVRTSPANASVPSGFGRGLLAGRRLDQLQLHLPGGDGSNRPRPRANEVTLSHRDPATSSEETGSSSDYLEDTSDISDEYDVEVESDETGTSDNELENEISNRGFYAGPSGQRW